VSTQLQPGYKQTEVGVIPEDWVVAQIGELEPFVTSGSRGWAEYYSEHGSPFIRITNLSRACIYPDLKDLRYVNVAITNSEAARTQLCDGDVLISITADIGIVGLVTAKLPKPAYINQHIALVRFDAAETDSRFVSYFLASENSQKLFRAMTDSGAKAGMNLTTVQQIRIAFPSAKAEQEAIAEALSDADALIESLEQLVAKKRHFKQGAMQELLTGKKRLPGFQVKLGYKNTEAGAIPEDWEVVSMGQVSECLIGLTYSPLDVRDFGTLVLRSSNVQNGKLAFDDNVFVEMEIPGRAITQKNDILICVRNGSRQLIGKCALIDDATAGSAFGAFMSVLRSNSAKFLFFQFQSNFQKGQIDEVMGATINQITNKDLAIFKVIWPSDIAEQTAIATVLSDMDAEIVELESQLAKARTIKQGMMHKLLTGKVRLI
jgi:type I restriction enzyme S subunit